MGQKGVVGLMLPQHLMPFTEDGLVPDIIVNPHAIPSRMTIGQLAESLLAIRALTGQRGNGTAFRNVQLHEISDQLEKRLRSARTTHALQRFPANASTLTSS